MPFNFHSRFTVENPNSLLLHSYYYFCKLNNTEQNKIASLNKECQHLTNPLYKFEPIDMLRRVHFAGQFQLVAVSALRLDGAIMLLF